MGVSAPSVDTVVCVAPAAGVQTLLYARRRMARGEDAGHLASSVVTQPPVRLLRAELDRRRETGPRWHGSRRRGDGAWRRSRKEQRGEELAAGAAPGVFV